MRLLVLLLLSLLLLHMHLAVDIIDNHIADDFEQEVGELHQQDESVFSLMKAQVMNDLKMVGMLIPPQVKAYVAHVYGRMRSDGKHIIQGLMGEMLSSLGRLINKLSSQVVKFGEKMKENSEKQIKIDTVEASDKTPTVVAIEYTGGYGRHVEDEELDEDNYDTVEI